MPNIHIEGYPGTGKTSVQEELKKRGYHTIDADKHFAHIRPPIKGFFETPNPFDWVWDETKVQKELIEKVSEKAKFVCGWAMNHDKFADCFAKVFVLYLNNEELKKRLLARTNNHSGKNPAHLSRILELNQDGEGPRIHAEAKGATLIDASQPVEKVVDEILSHLKE